MGFSVAGTSALSTGTFGAMDLTDLTVRAQVASEIFGGSEYQTDLINSTAQTYNQGVPMVFYQMYLNRATDSVLRLILADRNRRQKS